MRCEVLTCDPPNELAYTWVVGDLLDTRVRYRLERDGSGTRVFFEHAGFEQEPARKGAAYGWSRMHGELSKLLEQNRSRV